MMGGGGTMGGEQVHYNRDRECASGACSPGSATYVAS